MERSSSLDSESDNESAASDVMRCIVSVTVCHKMRLNIHTYHNGKGYPFVVKLCTSSF